MDQASFDRIARLLGGAATRRQGLAAALGGALGLAAAPVSGELAAAAPASRRRKHRVGKQGPCGNGARKDNICTDNSQCCTGICNSKTGKNNIDGKGRCRCLRRGEGCKADRNCCGKLTCVASVCANGSPTPPDPCATPTVCASGCPQSTVQAAIDAADAGATISIGPGVWTGNLTIGKNLTIVGCGATLIDAGNSRTITMTGSPVVELRNLIVDGTGAGPAVSVTAGGGILVSGTLTLSGTTVVSNGATDTYGGCLTMAKDGPGSVIVMTDSARLDTCFAGTGGGGAAVFGAAAALTMSGSASIVNCDGVPPGGGVLVENQGSVTMTGSSSIRNCFAMIGGGIAFSGPNSLVTSLTISSPATITGNTAGTGSSAGGGIFAVDPGRTFSIGANTIVGNISNNCGGEVSC